MVTDWSRTGHGLVTDRFAENSRSLRGHKRGYPVDFPGRCREIARLLRGCDAGHCTGCDADIARKLPDNCPDN